MPIGGLAGLNERTIAVTVGRPSAEAQPNSAVNRSRPNSGLRPRLADDAHHGPDGHGEPFLARHETALDPGATIGSCACDRFFAAGGDRAPFLHPDPRC